MNVPDERLRAAELEIACANEGSRYTSFGARLNMERVRKTLSDVWDSAMREAAGLMCQDCRNTEDMEPSAFINGKWRHKVKQGKGSGYFTCDAAPIHERLALKGGKE